MNSNIAKVIFALTLALGATSPTRAAVIAKTLCVNNATLTLGGAPVPFWGFVDCSGGMMGGGMAPGSVPGPEQDVSPGDTLSLTLNVMMMTPQENAPYNGHTIHMHGADLPSDQDGVPETSAADTSTATYSWTPTPEMVGSYFYHCHVHTVKHLEMGMYGPLIVRPKDANGNMLNQITYDPATRYDYSQIYLFSSVDPAYHASTAIMDSPVFADYNPAYFLIDGLEGTSKAAPAVTLQAKLGAKVALRLLGVMSVNGSFQVTDASGKPQPFTVYVQDGRAWPTPETVTQLDITPAQRFDILLTLPSTSGAWYPQMTFKSLRDATPFATAYGKISF